MNYIKTMDQIEGCLLLLFGAAMFIVPVYELCYESYTYGPSSEGLEQGIVAAFVGLIFILMSILMICGYSNKAVALLLIGGSIGGSWIALRLTTNICWRIPLIIYVLITLICGVKIMFEKENNT